MGFRSLLPRRRERTLSTFLGAPLRPRRTRALVLERLEDRRVLSTSIPLSTGVWTAMGPSPITGGQTPGANPVSGQITGIATNPTNPNQIYVATGGGGVWDTFNGGTTWFPLTDDQPTLFMGSIALAPSDPSVIYAGTGNANNGANSDYGLGILMSSDGGSTWSLENDNGVFTGQSIAKIVVSPTNPDTVYAAVSAGGVNGVREARATGTESNGAVNAITVTDDGAGYTSAPLVTITGGGGTGATAVATLNGGGSIASIVITSGGSGYTSSPTITIDQPSAAATGIYLSTNGGQTWTDTTTNISTIDDYTDLVINPANPSNLYAAIGTPGGSVNNGVYVTTNGGTTWQPAGAFFPTGSGDGRIALGISSNLVNPTVYAAITNPSTGGLESIDVLTNGGGIWTVPYSTANAPANYLGNQGNYDTFVAVSPTVATTVFVGGSFASTSSSGQQLDSILESTNGGSTWTDISAGANNSGPHVGQTTYAFDANGDLLDGNDGGIWRLNNSAIGNIQWQDLNGNLDISEVNGLALTPNNSDLAYASTAYNGVDEFNDSLSWSELLGGDGGQLLLNSTTSPVTLEADTAFVVDSAANTSFVQVSTNGGASWTSSTTGITTATDNGGTYPPLVVDPSNPNVLLLGTDIVYESINDGQTWTPISVPETGGFSFSGWKSNAPITALAIAPINPNNPNAPQTIYAATADGHIFVSNNNGTTWSQRDVQVGTNLIGGPETDFWLDPNDPTGNTVYTVRAAFNSGVDTGHVFMSTNGGQTWTDLSGNLPNLPTWSIAIDTRSTTARMYVGTDDGVYASSDGGVTWTPYKTGLPNVQVTQLVLDPTTDILAAGTHGRGLYEISIQQTIAVQMTAPASAVAGEAVSGDVAQFTDLVDPSQPAANYSASIAWGDGQVTNNATLSPAPGGGYEVAGSHTYEAPGTYTIGVTIQDSNGNSGQNSSTITVADASLTAPTNATVNATEGQTFSGLVTTFLYGNPSAPASDFTATIIWGNGRTTSGTVVADPQGGGLFDVDGSNFYNEYGTYSVANGDPLTVTITDTFGTSITVVGTAIVADAPLFSTPETFNALAGTSFTGTVALFTDSNPVGVLTDYSATINWGDGSGTSSGTIGITSGGLGVTGTHLYTEAGTYTVTVTINDAGGASTTAQSTAKVADAALLASPQTVSGAKGKALANNTVIATFTDGNIYAQPLDFSATTINWGDGSNATGATIVSQGSGKFEVEAGHTYAAPGSYPVTVNIVSSGGSKTSARSTAEIADVPVTPSGVTITPPGAGTVIAGSTLSNVLVATFTDPYSGPLGYYGATINWGDNSAPSAGTIAIDPQVQGQYDVYGSHTYALAGNYTVTTTIQDGGGGTATVNSPAQVVAAPLTFKPASIPTMVIGNTFTSTVATFNDPNSFDVASDFTASINWGNGTINAGQVVGSGGQFSVVGTNTYSQLSGSVQVFPITITIYDLNASSPAVVNNTVDVQDASITANGQTIDTVEGSTYSGQVASFVDGDPQAPLANFSASIAWGNGNTSAGTIQALGGGSFTVSGSNTYINPGTYPIAVTISDVSGASAVAVSTADVAGAALTPVTSAGFSVFQGNTYSGPVAEFSDANTSASVGEFTATINWGNGTVNAGNVLQIGSGLFQVTGTNAYSAAGLFPVSVSITSIGGTRTVVASTVDVLVPLVGTIGNNGYTNNAEPTFAGTAQPGAVISLFVTSASGTSATGRAVVGANGQWSAQVGPALANGTYSVTATMVTTSGLSSAPLTLGTLHVVTQGPTVAAAAFTPATGQLSITFQDAGGGLNPAALANAANYTLSLVSKGKLKNFGVVGLETVPGPGANEMTEIVSYDLGIKPPAGTYVVTLNADGLTDIAGNTLVATPFVKFPQTTNSPDPDYIAQFTVNKKLVASGPSIYIPAGERAAAAKFAKRLHALKVKHFG